jgi:hypothetical protein
VFWLVNLYSLFVYIEHNGDESPKDSPTWSLLWYHDSWISASDIIIHFIHIGFIYSFKQSVGVLHKQWFARPCAWWYYHLWKCCLHVLARTMQQEYITMSIAMISVAWRKSHTGCSISQLLHVFSRLYLKWTSVSPSSDVGSTHILVFASAFAEISVLSLIVNYFCFLILSYAQSAI